MNIEKVTDTKDLVAGALYCCFVQDDDGDRDGELVYWTGEMFADEDGEDASPDYDYLVRQVGDINPDMVD